MALTNCPACNKSISSKAVPKHVQGCASWDTVIGVPPSEYNWDAYHKRGPYADGLVEGTDYVRCQVCMGKDMRFKRMMDHLKKVHGLTESTYLAQHPGAMVRVAGTLQKREATVTARYGVTNVFQTDEVKAKSRDKMLVTYGVASPLQSSLIRQQVAETNLQRYGHVNPFGSHEIQEKIRQVHLANYGVENPNQAPEVIARRMATNRERYGADHYLQTEDFKDDFRAASQERFGTDHPMQSDEGKRLWEQGCVEAFGVPNPLLVPEIFLKTYESNLASHGGKHSQQCPDVLAKARETWLEKYGVDNPSKVEAIKQKIKDVWESRYGVPLPMHLWAKRVRISPNGLEQRVQGLSPSGVVFTGDFTYPVRRPGGSRDRYPDFIVLTGEQIDAYRAGANLRLFRTPAVIEAFGDWWHGPEMKGKSRDAHQDEVIQFYADCGIQCLIVWESEVNKRPQVVAERIRRFLIDVNQGS